MERQERALERFRPQVVRLCARLAGSGEWAEELAQETLIEAWRNSHKLTTGELSFAWLAQIAQFVVRRWRRRQERTSWREHSLELVTHEPATDPTEERSPLERAELALLLGRALETLPPKTRSLLVRNYWEGQSLQEIAERDRITAANAAVRLWRGRLALQEALVQHFPEEAVAYGLITPEQSLWRETTIWCANCGQCRLLAHQGKTDRVYRCPRCHPNPDPEANLVFLREELPRGPLPGDRVFMRRISKRYAETVLPGLVSGQLRCCHCNRPVPLVRYTPLCTYPTLHDRYGVWASCEACRSYAFGATLGRLYMAHPRVQQFWSRHPRMRRLPEQDIAYEGVPALAIAFESVPSKESLTVIVRRDSFALLGIEGG